MQFLASAAVAALLFIAIDFSAGEQQGNIVVEYITDSAGSLPSILPGEQATLTTIRVTNSTEKDVRVNSIHYEFTQSPIGIIKEAWVNIQGKEHALLANSYNTIAFRDVTVAPHASVTGVFEVATNREVGDITLRIRRVVIEPNIFPIIEYGPKVSPLLVSPKLNVEVLEIPADAMPANRLTVLRLKLTAQGGDITVTSIAPWFGTEDGKAGTPLRGWSNMMLRHEASYREIAIKEGQAHIGKVVFEIKDGINILDGESQTFRVLADITHETPSTVFTMLTPPNDIGVKEPWVVKLPSTTISQYHKFVHKPSPLPPPLYGDANRDGSVDFFDLLILIEGGGQFPEGDLNGDGKISMFDALWLLLYLFEEVESFPVEKKNVAQAPSALPQNLSEVLSQLAERVQDPQVKAFIAHFQREMSATQPQTRLLQNYPNPCNPETWIPFELAKTSDVIVTIYSAHGKAIRTLNLGSKSHGVYLTRAEAAYWDGRNDYRECVPSGVYFYELVTGDVRIVKKMMLVK